MYVWQGKGTEELDDKIEDGKEWDKQRKKWEEKVMGEKSMPLKMYRIANVFNTSAKIGTSRYTGCTYWHEITTTKKFNKKKKYIFEIFNRTNYVSIHYNYWNEYQILLFWMRTTFTHWT